MAPDSEGKSDLNLNRSCPIGPTMWRSFSTFCIFFNIFFCFLVSYNISDFFLSFYFIGGVLIFFLLLLLPYNLEEEPFPCPKNILHSLLLNFLGIFIYYYFYFFVQYMTKEKQTRGKLEWKENLQQYILIKHTI